MNLPARALAPGGLPSKHDLLAKLARGAIGLDVAYTLATGKRQRRIYLDSTASTLRLDVVQSVLDRYQPYYANTHSLVHFGARLSTREYAWAHDMVLDFVRADRKTHTSFFVGSGTTGGMNRVARAMRARAPERDVVITSIMEHHSNDLPHRKHFRKVVHVGTERGATSMGSIDVEAIERALIEHGDTVNYVSVTGVSNVTGILNPIYRIAELVHRHGALIVVDAAQMVAHVPVQMSGNADPACDLDVLVFSGHKIYAPGSPGVVVARCDLFQAAEPTEVGGGMVQDVWLDRYTATDVLPDREEAGTPNICGAIGLGAALYALDRVGMDLIHAEERALMHYTVGRLNEIPDVVIYGDPDLQRYERSGAVSFNIRGMHHALTAAILNDYFAISVRNQCFCAHPYVREMVAEALTKLDLDMANEELEALAEMQRGMVRASFGIYTTREDIDALASALREISVHRDTYAQHYQETADGSFEHTSFRFDHARHFSIAGEVDRWMGNT